MGQRRDDDGDTTAAGGQHEDPSRPGLRDEIMAAVQRMGVSSRRVGDVFAAREGLHSTDVEALLFVMQAQARSDPPTAGALADSLGVSTGAATAVIDRLERAGHLERHRDHRDRRKVILRYTDAARAVAEEFFSPLVALSDDILGTLSVSELRTVARFLAALTDAMDRHTCAARDRHGPSSPHGVRPGPEV